MKSEYEAALRAELALLRNSPDRPAKDRRISEVLAQLGESADAPGSEDAAESAPKETAVTRKTRSA